MRPAKLLIPLLPGTLCLTVSAEDGDAITPDWSLFTGVVLPIAQLW